MMDIDHIANCYDDRDNLVNGPVTLIVAVRESDVSILVAADGLERSSTGVFSVTKTPKLHTAPDLHQPVIWACFGDATLSAGWPEKLAGIWEIDANYIQTAYWEKGFLSIGGLAGEAELIWNAMQNSGLTPLDMLQRVFKTISDGRRSIGYPLDIWRIIPAGVIIVEGRTPSPTALHSKDRY